MTNTLSNNLFWILFQDLEFYMFPNDNPRFFSWRIEKYEREFPALEEKKIIAFAITYNVIKIY